MHMTPAYHVFGRDELCQCCGHYSPYLDRTYRRCERCYSSCPAIGRCGRRTFELVAQY